MADKGIIFSAPMVRALLAGRKSQTRRLAKFVRQQPNGDWHCHGNGGGMMGMDEAQVRQWGYSYSPYAPGDRLYVRECAQEVGEGYLVTFRADYPACVPDHFDNVPSLEQLKTPWRPSIHMPRKWSRLTLLVTDVRVQRVSEISEDDAVAEGIEPVEYEGERAWKSYETYSDGTPHPHASVPNRFAKRSFEELWNSLHDKPGERWSDNPWIVAITFNVQHGNIDRIAA